MRSSDVHYLGFKWGVQVSDGWIYRIGPNQVGLPKVSLEDCAVEAVAMLRAGHAVRWEPGDGTSYHVYLLVSEGSRYLAFLNASFPGLLPLRHPTTVGDYVRSSAPQGGWRGVRPLLVALGAIATLTNPFDLDKRKADVTDEAKERSRQHHTQYVADGDAVLGREVRLLVLAKERPT